MKGFACTVMGGVILLSTLAAGGAAGAAEPNYIDSRYESKILIDEIDMSSGDPLNWSLTMRLNDRGFAGETTRVFIDHVETSTSTSPMKTIVLDRRSFAEGEVVIYGLGVADPDNYERVNLRLQSVNESYNFNLRNCSVRGAKCVFAGMTKKEIEYGVYGWEVHFDVVPVPMEEPKEGEGDDGGGGEEGPVTRPEDSHGMTEEREDQHGVIVENESATEKVARLLGLTDDEILKQVQDDGLVLDGGMAGDDELPETGETTGVTVGGELWLFVVAGLVSTIWLIIVVFKARKKHEDKNTLAIAKIVAANKK